MHVSLSDLLACPRCGPTYGLVLLPVESVERRVRTGVLGCANCRERYPIEGGVADLRTVAAPGGEPGGSGSSPGPGSGEGEAWGAGAEAAPATRLAGLMGLAGAGGTVLVAGPAAGLGPALAALLDDVEVVVEESAVRVGMDPGVSRIRVSGVLPFRSESLRGVALTGDRAALLDEGARVLGRTGNLVVDPAPPDASARLEMAGLDVRASEGGVVVAARQT